MIERSLDGGQMPMRGERTLGVVLLVAGLAIAGAAVTRMGSDNAVHAQATPPVIGAPLPPAPAEKTAPPLEKK